MLKFLKILTQDPILILTTIVLVAAVVILAWALIEYFGFFKRISAARNGYNYRMPPNPENIKEDELEPPQETDTYVLFEARMKEVSNQLAEIGRRLVSVEKQLILNKSASDQTIQISANASTAELEKFIQRIEKRLELISTDSAQPVGGDQLSKLEAKIEGIHKLLIILTDSGVSEQK